MSKVKSVLVIEDNILTKEFYEKKLGLYHDVEFFLYNEDSALPTGSYDVLITDGLEGDYTQVMREINANKKILVTESKHFVKEDSEFGKTAIRKTEYPLLENILEEIKK